MIFCVDWYFHLLLLTTNIADKDIWFLHELIFCVNLDFLFSLVDTHIADKDSFYSKEYLKHHLT